MMLLKTHLYPIVHLDSEEFRAVFFRKVVLDGSVYMDPLTRSHWDRYIEDLVADRGLPPRDITGPWTLPAVLPPGTTTRIAEWNAVARSWGIFKGFCDAAQHTHCTENIMTVMPTLLQNSDVLSILSRALHPLEHCAVFGLPVLEKDRSIVGECQCLLSLELVLSLSWREAKSLIWERDACSLHWIHDPICVGLHAETS